MKASFSPEETGCHCAVNVNIVRQDQFEMQLIQHGANSHFVILFLYSFCFFICGQVR